MRSVAAVDGTVLQASDGLKINGVLIGKLDTQTTDNIHATDKADAINALTSEHGVTARGFNKLKTTFDLAGATLSDHGDFTVNGITIGMASVTTTTTLVTTLNTGLRQTDITASADESSNIIFESASGLTITIDDSTDATGAGDLLKTATYMDGSAATTTISSGNVTARGFIELTAASGGSIKIEDGQQDTLANNGTTRIGFNSQNEEGKASSQGVNVRTIDAATTSLARIDNAIATVSKFRANFGAFENRLDAAISNLTTQQINTDAARSRIEDADFAGETNKLTKAQILNQAATSMLAQANASKNSLLALLQG